MVFRKLIFILSIPLLGFTTHGQASGTASKPIITLMASEVNLQHPFYKLLVKKDADYIEWLYYHCVRHTKSASSTVENESLVFAVTHEGKTRQDTIATCVSFKVYEDERSAAWKNEIPLYGRLPSQVTASLENDPEEGFGLKLRVGNPSVHAHIYLLNAKGEDVHTLTNKKLNTGDYDFQWDASPVKEGQYLLYVNIDNELVIYRIDVRQHWFLNLFKKEKHTYRTVLSRPYDENVDAGLLEGKQLTFTSHNRFGSSVGVRLLSKAQVDIQLLTLEGKAITGIVQQELPEGESSFALSDKVSKAGAYLLRIAINDTIQYTKTNIQL